MSVGLAPSDLIKLAELAYNIYDKCFSQSNGADVKYLQFGTEIKNLSQSLYALAEVYEKVVHARQLRSWPPSAEAIASAINAVPQLTGDFQSTLQECEAILRTHFKLQTNGAGFMDNVRWNVFGLSRDVDTLRERVHLHSSKVLIVTKQLELELLLDLWEAKFSTQNAQETPDSTKRLDYRISPELNGRFSDALSLNKPGSFKGIQDFPLKEGFDALIAQFTASTVSYKPASQSQNAPDAKQYLNLLKSRWILERIKQGSPYIREGPASLWAKCINKVEKDIEAEYLRFDSAELETPDEKTLYALPSIDFATWLPGKTSDAPIRLTDERAFEEKILEINSSPDPIVKSRLVVFRKSETELRIVTSKIDSENNFLESEGYEMNILSTRFIPGYAVPNLQLSTHDLNVLLCNRTGSTERAILFHDERDMLSFQQACTGFKVVYNESNVSWSSYRMKSSLRLKTEQENGIGRVQIWQAKPLSRIRNESLSETSPQQQSPTTSTTSPRSDIISSPVEVSKEAKSFITTASQAKRSDDSTGNIVTGLVIKRPIIPAIVVFTIHHNRYTYLHLKMETDVFINPESCSCKQQDTCVHVNIESKQNNLALRRYCVQEEFQNGLNTWDLIPLFNSAHEDSKKVESLSKVRWFRLTFQTRKEKDNFQTRFHEVRILRDMALRDYRDQQARLSQRADNAGRPASSRSASVNS